MSCGEIRYGAFGTIFTASMSKMSGASTRYVGSETRACSAGAEYWAATGTGPFGVWITPIGPSASGALVANRQPASIPTAAVAVSHRRRKLFTRLDMLLGIDR